MRGQRGGTWTYYFTDDMKLQKKLEDDDAPCEICHQKGEGEKMLLCDNCDSGILELPIEIV